MASMSVRNECSICGKKFLASCESVCKKCSPQNLPKADAYSLLADVRADVKELLHMLNESATVIFPNMGYHGRYKVLKKKISEHFS